LISLLQRDLDICVNKSKKEKKKKEEAARASTIYFLRGLV